jgi:hypothetical protein
VSSKEAEEAKRAVLQRAESHPRAGNRRLPRIRIR